MLHVGVIVLDPAALVARYVPINDRAQHGAIVVTAKSIGNKVTWLYGDEIARVVWLGLWFATDGWSFDIRVFENGFKQNFNVS